MGRESTSSRTTSSALGPGKGADDRRGEHLSPHLVKRLPGEAFDHEQFSDPPTREGHERAVRHARGELLHDSIQAIDLKGEQLTGRSWDRTEVFHGRDSCEDDHTGRTRCLPDAMHDLLQPVRPPGCARGQKDIWNAQHQHRHVELPHLEFIRPRSSCGGEVRRLQRPPTAPQPPGSSDEASRTCRRGHAVAQDSVTGDRHIPDEEESIRFMTFHLLCALTLGEYRRSDIAPVLGEAEPEERSRQEQCKRHQRGSGSRRPSPRFLPTALHVTPRSAPGRGLVRIRCMRHPATIMTQTGPTASRVPGWGAQAGACWRARP